MKENHSVIEFQDFKPLNSLETVYASNIIELNISFFLSNTSYLNNELLKEYKDNLEQNK